MEDEDNKNINTKKFFNKLNPNKKNKPKSTIYDVYYCVFTDTNNQDEYIGSWVSSIDKDDIYNKETSNIKISGDEKDNHIRIRLKGLLETLKWIVGNTDVCMYKYITVNLHCNDPFIVNMVGKWIPSWIVSDYNISEGEERPNKHIISDIGNISTKINIHPKWMSPESHEMSLVAGIANNSIIRLKEEK